MKIAILGAAGMAGHMIYSYLSEKGYDCEPYYHKNTDGENLLIFNAENENDILRLVFQNDYDCIINCIGILIKESEANPERAIRVNALFPKILERFAKESNIKVIHISTDCVFSGSHGNYRENSPKDGLDVYAKTKALGEIINEKDLTIRTSIIGPELKHKGTGLFDWYIRQEGSTDGYADHFWSGVTTLELAKAIEYVLQNPICGLVHLTNNIKISKYELLTLINKHRPTNRIEIRKVYTGHVVDKSLTCDSNKFRYNVPSYEEMIIDLFKYMENHSRLYSEKYF